MQASGSIGLQRAAAQCWIQPVPRRAGFRRGPINVHPRPGLFLLSFCTTRVVEEGGGGLVGLQLQSAAVWMRMIRSVGERGAQQRETRDEGEGNCSSAILCCGRECGSRPEEEVGWWRRRGGEEADHEGKTREDAEESFFRLNYCVECYISVEKQTKTRQPEPIGCCRAVGGIWAMGSAVLARPAGFPLQQSVGHAEGGSPGFSSSFGFSAADRMFGGFGHGGEGQPRRCRLTDEAPQIANCKCSQPA